MHRQIWKDVTVIVSVNLFIEHKPFQIVADRSCEQSQYQFSVCTAAPRRTGASNGIAQATPQCLRHLSSTISYHLHFNPEEYGAVTFSVQIFCDLTQVLEKYWRIF